MGVEEWISLNEYMKRYKIGYATVKQMIYDKEIEAIQTPRRTIQNKNWGKHSIKRNIWKGKRTKNTSRNNIGIITKSFVRKEVRK